MARTSRVLSSVLVVSLLLVWRAAPAAAQAPDPHYAAGVAAFAAGDYPKTITEMNASIEARPNPKALLYLGNAYLKLGQLGGAKVVGGGNLSLVEWNLGADTNGAYPRSSATAGVRVGVQLLPRLAVEADARWVGLPNSRDDGLGHGLTTEGNVLFHVLGGKWTPIVEAGAGSYEVLSSKLGADADLRVHAGVGLRGALGKWLHVRADVRDVITDGFDKSIGNNLELLLGVEAYLWQKE